MTLATVLDAERKRQELTVYRLAKDSGMSAGRLAAILDGTTANPGILTVAAVVAGLGQSMAWLAARPGLFDRPKATT
jgi:transcriptional regulator with XRE-family HTH domain